MKTGWNIGFRVDPSFENDGGYALYISGDVIENINECRMWVYHDKALEIFSWNTLLKSEPIKISREVVSGIYEKLLNTNITAAPPFVGGLDGVFYTLEISCFFNSVVYKWWNSLPEQWDNLNQIIDELDALAKRSKNA